ncbi:glycosyltransferase [Phaeodactylibacter xiamenensis]|jgi:glycosyltransferase involved in cell wall biosynthesis|uniref:glycosyltransferase n=1 Tax=Phaeodactylibacter xiamenensis TaxID=1524460 RepID=UPI0024A989F8|nr:glycosyltransferase [Phaeodactylibacter xiamenensis]
MGYPEAMEPILLGLFLAATFVQLLYWLGLFSRLALYRQPPPPKVPPEPVSIIICAHNEAENLRQNLPLFLAQDYPDFEVLVVNDASTDNSLEILLEFKRKSPNLRVANLTTKVSRGKKAALSKGIKAAKHSILLLSDADCRPVSSKWLEHMQAFIRDRVEIGLGYSPYIREKGILNATIRFETVYSAVQYSSFAFVGMPYMGVGRNLIYRKHLYREAGGFDDHMDVTSGDDDLFINAVATPYNTRVILSPEAFVFSKAKSSWRGYYRQKSRHLSTGTRYRPVHQLLLGALSASHFGHYVFGLALILFHNLETIVFINYLVRIVVVTAMYGLITRKLRDPSLVFWVPLFDALFILYYLIFAPALFKKKEPWT